MQINILYIGPMYFPSSLKLPSRDRFVCSGKAAIVEEIGALLSSVSENKLWVSRIFVTPKYQKRIHSSLSKALSVLERIILAFPRCILACLQRQVDTWGQAYCFDKMTSHFPFVLDQETIVLQNIQGGASTPLTCPRLSASKKAFVS